MVISFYFKKYSVNKSCFYINLIEKMYSFKRLLNKSNRNRYVFIKKAETKFDYYNELVFEFTDN